MVWALRGMVVLGCVWLALGFAAAVIITYPRNSAVPEHATLGETALTGVSFAASDGVVLSAWLGDAGGDRAVVLANGIYGNRQGLKRRAEFYLQRGISPLLLDLRGTGTSARANITIGWDERKDIQAAEDFLRERGYRYVGAQGVSLGASAIAYALKDEPGFDFVVLESCYDSLDHAWRNRLAMFNVPHVITWPVRWFTEARIGAPARLLAPVDFVAHAKAPTLIVAGDSELELKASETQEIFDRCGAPEKHLHFFKGGRHHDFYSHFTEEYEGVLGGFLERHTAGWAAPQAPQIAGERVKQDPAA